MAKVRSNNMTHAGLTDEDYEAYRNRKPGEKGYYEKPWQQKEDAEEDESSVTTGKLPRSNNMTHAGLSEEDYEAYRNRPEGQKGHYKKTWQDGADMDWIEKQRFRKTPEYEGSELQKKDEIRQKKMDKVMATFERYDMDHDHFLSVREFGRIFVDCGMDRKDAEMLFKQVDLDHSKYLSIDELVKWLFKEKTDYAIARTHCMRAVDPEEAVKEFFAYLQDLRKVAMDPKDETGAKQKMEKLFGKADFSFEDVFKQMDMSKNGEVSMGEFMVALSSMGHNIDQKMMRKIFGLIDQAVKNDKGLVNEKNELILLKNGIIDEKEFQEAWDKAARSL